MGYADPNQLGSGLRQRLYSRAFIVGDLQTPQERFIYLVLDTQSGDTAVRHGILEGLKNMGEEYSAYGSSNVAVTGTHSHSGPGAWVNYLLPQITSKGFDKQSYEAIVSGALRSIRRAHDSLAPGRLDFVSGPVLDANINRSPYAYLANPIEERERYEHDVDKIMSLLHFTRSSDDKSVGVLTWFPTHGTSMLGNNTLVTGDNKGVAAYLLEKSTRAKKDSATEDFVAGFSQANVGDTSPNVLGAYCEDGSGQQCSFEASTCGGKTQPCHGRGPHFGLDDGGTQSCFEIGKRQADAAKSLLSLAKSSRKSSGSLHGAIRSLHFFKDLAGFEFEHTNGTTVKTCPAALGYSFAAGTTDGPGPFDFKQNNSGTPNASPLWSAVRDFIHQPNETQVSCHAPKPILLDVGETTRPYLWTPNIVDIQLLRVGSLLIVVAPGEATTMAGRRWKEAIQREASRQNITSSTEGEPSVVLGGPANTYAHYIATKEEYSIQRYEGASTLYGPHTLNAYISLTTTSLGNLSSKASPKSPRVEGPEPPVYVNESLSFINPVIFDRPGLFQSFGDTVEDVEPPAKRTYRPGETASAVFVGANPRNNLRQEETFASVLRLGQGLRKSVATDEDWELVFEWRRVSELAGTSEATVKWEIPNDVAEGRYQLVYHGDSKAFGSGTITKFMGMSCEFAVGGSGR